MKFDDLYRIILESEYVKELEAPDALIDLLSSPEWEKFQAAIEASFKHTLEAYKKRFPGEFDAITLSFEPMYTAHGDMLRSDIWKNNIRIGLYAIIRQLKLGISLDDILDRYEDTYVIAEELAHYADIKKHPRRKMKTDAEVHNDEFKAEFGRITGKDFDSVRKLQNEV